jgi:hypothetical protein
MEPRSSPVGYLLDPMQREPVCAALNSAILGLSVPLITGNIFLLYTFSPSNMEFLRMHKGWLMNSSKDYDIMPSVPISAKQHLWGWKALDR